MSLASWADSLEDESMKRAAFIVVALALIVSLSVVGYALFGGAKEPDYSKLESFEVQRQSISATVSATGRIAPKAEISLALKTGGKVAAISVEKGQSVKAGDVLIRLESTDLEFELAQAHAGLSRSRAELARVMRAPRPEEIAAAEAELARAQAEYADLLDGADEEELAAAKAELTSAQAAYKKLLAGPDEDDVAIAKVDLERARIALEQAQSDYDQVSWIGGVGALPQALALQQATYEYEAAKARYNKAVAGPTQAEIREAEARLARARANLAALEKNPTVAQLKAAEVRLAQARSTLQDLRERPRAEEIIIAQAQLEQAQATFEQARLRLEETTLTAPFDGLVSAVNVEIGEQVSPGTPVIGLVDASRFHIDVNVDEIDIGRLALGQPVSISLEAYRDRKIAGHVSSIAPTASTSEGVISYVVTIEIEPTDVPLRAGMSADAEITTDYLAEALVVPNRFVRVDRQSGKAFVDRLKDGLISRVEIKTGIRNEIYSQVLEGLEEGDKVVLRPISSEELLRRFITE